MTSLYSDYLNERYLPSDFDLKKAADHFEDIQIGHFAREILKKDEGFLVHEIKGDAVLFHDFYVKPEHRGHGKSWDFYNEVVDKAKAKGCRVIIAFSEIEGKDHIKGLKALKVGGFQPLFKTNDAFVFIKGI